MVGQEAHGRHISAIILGNIQAVAPELIDAGIFGVVLPPYYELWYGKKKSNRTNLYVREQDDIVKWRARYVYHTGIDVQIVNRMNLDVRFVLNVDQYVPFADFICTAGSYLDNLANELSIPPALIEELAKVTYFLTPETMDVDAIRTITGLPVTYNQQFNVLGCSIGREDYRLPLHNVAASLCADLVPWLNRWAYDKWCITARNRADGGEFKFITLYQLYSSFKNMDKDIFVKPLKGLGSMDQDDLGPICMNPRTRRTLDITCAGDLEQVFALLGDNSEPRKQLLKSPIVYRPENYAI